MKSQSKKSYMGDMSQRSGGLNEDNENIDNITSSSKSKNTKYSSNTKLSEKRERSKESTKISENPYKQKKISDSQKEFLKVKEMTDTQIGREKDELKKEIEAKQKMLNYLEIYEKIKNEMNKEIKKTLIKESKNSKFNNNKDKILKIVKEITLIVYKKKEKSLNSQVKNMIKEDINNFLEQIKNFDEINLDTVLRSQYFDNDKKNTGVSDINLDESKYKDLNNTQKSKNKSEYIKKSKTSQNEEYNTYKNSKINKYSIKLLTNNLNFAIQKGIKEGIFTIEIENNGSFPWPQNKAFLVIDNFKSNINIQNIELDPLNPGEKASVNVLLNQMDKYGPGKYNIHLDFMVDGKKYCESILINIEVTENINKVKHKTIIIAFRNYYDFTKSVFSDTRIGNELDIHQNFENAEHTLFKEEFNKHRKKNINNLQKK